MTKKYQFLVLLIVTLAWLGWNYRPITADQTPNVKGYMLDVGQGDALYFTTQDGEDILIDGGPDSKALTALGKLKPFFDHRIDLVIATHPDADHIAGLVKILAGYQAQEIWWSGDEKDSQTFRSFKQELDASPKNGALVKQVHQGDARHFDCAKNDPGDCQTEVDVLAPRSIQTGTRASNANGIVLKIQNHGSCILLTDDIEQPQEDELVAQYPSGLHCDILKVAHHGSSTSSTAAFLNAVQPKLALISVGKNNSYGHPKPVVLERLKAIGAKILRTDQTGQVQFTIPPVN